MLKVSNLSIGYNAALLLHFDDFELHAKEQCLIAGKSGCGKTTLLFTLAGILPPLRGEIVISGQSLTGMSESMRDVFRGAHIGFVFQALHLMPLVSVEDNLKLAFFANSQPIDQEKIAATLKRLDLYALKDRMPHTLSQGQAQRVSIARAVVHSPKLILADEPTSNLDDDNCNRVITLIQEVAEESGAALMVSTHDARIKSRFLRKMTLEGLPA